MERALALVVDSDPGVRAVIRDVFEEHEVTVLGAGDGNETREYLKSRVVGILLVDLKTRGLGDLGLLTSGRDMRQAPILIGLVPEENVADATSLIQSGAFDVLTKPVDEHRLQQVALRARAQHEILDQLRRLREELQGREGYDGLVGRTRVMERLRERLRQLGPTTACVWFTGEPGTGKELAARTLHELSAARESAFVVVPCAEITARDWSQRWHGDDGWMAQAKGGTLYFENITDLSVDLQERLLKIVAQGPTSRLLSSSATDPADAVEQGRLLAELQPFLIGETLTVPALRDRTEDIPLLARHFIRTVCEINHLPMMRLAPEALTLMERYRWPLNVQELRNTMEQAVILSTDDTITPRELVDLLPGSEAAPVGAPAPAPDGASLVGFRDAKREVVEAFELGYLRRLMERHGGNVTAASQQAGMLRSALQRLLRKYSLRSAEFRERRRARATEDATRPSVD